MSHSALRRVLIRMLHDPAFAAAVYADPAGALADVDVTATEIGWLTQTPRAAWCADAERPLRVLAALADEYPATLPLATEHAAGFLRAPEFHAAVQERGSLAVAFGAYLQRAPARAARCLAVLEQAIARVRRAPRKPPASGADRLRLTPRAALCTVPAGTLSLLERARRGRADVPLGGTVEAVLVAMPMGVTEVGLELVDPALAAILARAADGCSRPALLAVAREQGAEPGEDADILDRLVEDHLLL
jgi:hypothetical protein